jgi:hypothetical protein
MKKIIIGLSGILLVAFIVIKVANAQNSAQEVKKGETEMSGDCGKCPSASACGHMKDANTSGARTCDPAKCKEMGCDPAKCKEGKCDPATCKAKCANANAEGKKCDMAVGKCCAKK